MAAELLANNFATQLSVGCAPGDATIQVAAAAPAALQGGQFRILVDQEYMLVTGGQSGTVWNVTRGVEGSAAAQHLQGVWVTHLLTAGALFGGNLGSVGSGSPPSPNWLLIAWTEASAFQLASATRDGNGAITTASVVWPDGATGTFTTDTASAAFPGAIDAYHVTYVYGAGPTTKTITQTAVTRDAATGAVTVQPAITVA